MARKKSAGWVSTGMAVSAALGTSLFVVGAILWSWDSVGLLPQPGKTAISQLDLGASAATPVAATLAPPVLGAPVAVSQSVMPVVTRSWEVLPQPAFTTKPSPKCTDPPAGTDPMKVCDKCMACYKDSMKALAGGTGSDIVLGANNGKKYDPANWLNYWEDVPQHTKVFVEPVPPIFVELKENMKAIPNALPLNTAVRVPGGPVQLLLFCWDLDMVKKALKTGASPLPPEVRQPLEHWEFLCGLDKQKLLESSNVLQTPTYNALSPQRKTGVLVQVEKFIVQWNVPALTPKEIIDKAGPSNVRYVQIDVEGLDNPIVRALPLGQAGFWPEVVLYENNNGGEVRHIFEDQGYYTCCCVNKWGNNILAVRNHHGAKGAL
mmetsp:Transcript_63959/g.122977  ORF Transcript_63959/g.122977 Transcript_63959/m.122977 type:complete len:377 (+) Transcript_63959:84-1214(+)